MTKLILLFSPVFSYIEMFTKHHGVLKIIGRLILTRLKIDFHAINSTRNKYRKVKDILMGYCKRKQFCSTLSYLSDSL